MIKINKLILILIILTYSLPLKSQWIKINSPDLISISSISYCNNMIFVGSDNGNIFYSNDEGLTWNYIDFIKNKNRISDIYCIDSTLFVSIDGYDILYMSIDFGKNWVKSKVDNNSMHYWGGKFFHNSDYLYLILSKHIYRSKDKGENWERLTYINGIDNIVSNINTIEFDNQLRFIGTDKGVFISYNDCKTWEFLDFYRSNIRKVIFSNKTLVVSTQFGIYKSLDTGKTWDKINIDGVNLLKFYLLKSNSSLYLANNNAIYQSTDDGNNWQKIKNINESIYEYFIKTNNSFLIGTSDLIFFSNFEDTTWNLRIKNIKSNNITSFLESQKNLIVGTSKNGIYYSQDNGKNWIQKESNLTNNYIYDIKYYNNYLITGTFNGAYFSDDNGLSWTERNNGFIDFNSKHIREIKLLDKLLFASTFSGLYISNNNGLNWEICNSVFNDKVMFKTFSTDKSYFTLTINGNIYKSNDKGKTWKVLDKVIKSIMKNIEYSNDFLYIQDSISVYRSNDEGETWHQLYFNSQDLKINFIKVIGSKLILVCEDSILVSKDNGVSFTNITYNFPTNSVVNNIYLAQDSNSIYLTSNKGIFQIMIEDIGDISESEFYSNFKLYPNPSSSYIDIDFIEMKGVENISIYNTFGQTLITQKAETNSQRINIEQLPSGIYYIKIGDKVAKFVKI